MTFEIVVCGVRAFGDLNRVASGLYLRQVVQGAASYGELRGLRV